MTLRELSDQLSMKRHPNVPEHVRPRKTFSDSSANNLTTAIIAYFELKKLEGVPCKAWRQASEGRYIQGREYKDWMGRTRQEKGMYIPRSKAAKGISDIQAIIKGVSLFIEVKHGKDRMRPEQENFKEEVESMGAKYMVVKTWEDFQFQIDKLQ